MPKKILAVDDEPDILKVIFFRLKGAGYDVKTAIDGDQALEMLAQEKPDLILLDITLPTLSGYEVCKRVKSDEKLKDIPVIFLTASTASEGFKERAEEAGAQGYMFKPFEFDVLLAEINRVIN